MTRFRLAAVAALAVLVVGYAVYLMSLSRPVAPQTHETRAVVALVLPDGSISIGGERFSDPVKLKAKLAELRKEGGELEIHLRADPTMAFEPIGKAAMLLQKAGVANIGFITEPRNSPENK